MSQAPSMPLFVDAYLADTQHLSLEEHGAYLKLLMVTWRNNGEPLPDDDKRMRRILGVTPGRWGKLRPVLAEFFEINGGFWRQKRLEKEWKHVAEKTSKNRANGAKGGRPKSLKNNETDKANGSVSENQSDNRTGTQTESTHTHTHKGDISTTTESRCPAPARGEPPGGGCGRDDGDVPDPPAVIRSVPADPDGCAEAPAETPPEADAAFVRARFLELRDAHWPNEPRFPAPHMTIETHAQAMLDAGAPKRLIVEVLEQQMRKAAADGAEPPKSVNAYRLSVANAARGLRKSGGDGARSGVAALAPNWEESQWRERLRGYAERGFWLASWGPEPGPECEAPEEIMAEFGYGRAA